MMGSITKGKRHEQDTVEKNGKGLETGRSVFRGLLQKDQKHVRVDHAKPQSNNEPRKKVDVSGAIQDPDGSKKSGASPDILSQRPKRK